MGHALEFIETSVFTRQIKLIATDDELMELQKELIERPERGDLIPQTGGLYKMRMAIGNHGKRSGARVIYFIASAEIIYLLMTYPKNVKDDLTEAEKSALRKLTHALKNGE